MRASCAASMRVHPRACGGSPPRPAAAGRQQGTSPRVRGKQREARAAGVHAGYIPARAGEATVRRQGRDARRVHPRACGGSDSGVIHVVGSLGTSPRVRGKPPGHASAGSQPRYIPARAGEAHKRRGRPILATVHPRACGGSPRSVPDIVDEHGTSPRVRGKHSRAASTPCAAGYIPARAGEAGWYPSSSTDQKVHPRACGGSLGYLAHIEHYGGTSPRVRGKLARTTAPMPRPGYIPARAGEARWTSSATLTTRVHPRACGGSVDQEAGGAAFRGTSPRVRGKRR